MNSQTSHRKLRIESFTKKNYYIPEFGESLKDAGFRELFEETGVHLDDSAVLACDTLGLWESVFPAVLYEGNPKRHHIVVYILFKINILAAVLQEKLEVCCDLI